LAVFLLWAADAVGWIGLKSAPVTRIGSMAAVLGVSSLIYFGVLRLAGLQLRALVRR